MRLIDDADVFVNRNRAVIFDVVSRNTGIGMRGVSRKAGIPFSTVRYHVRRLEKQGLIGKVNYVVGIGGLNKSRVDRKHCAGCGKVFVENESKTRHPDDKGCWCIACDEVRGAGVR